MLWVLYDYSKEKNAMVIEIYLFRFIIYSIVAFLLGYFVVYQSLTLGDNSKGIDFFYVFKKLRLPNLLEFIWKNIIRAINILTGIELEIFPAKK